jgi:O-antigen/teichoic acid export membrane protein
MTIPFIRRNLPDGVWQSLITIVGNTLATGLSAVALILISRALGPTRFGEFSVGFAIVLILNKVNDGGLNATLLKFVPPAHSDQEKMNRFFSYTFKLKLIIAAIILLLGVGLTPWLSSVLNFPQPLIILLAFTLSFASTAYEHLLTMLQSLHRFSEAVAVNAAQSATKLLGALLLSFLAFSNNTIIFSFYMLAPVIPLVCTKWLLPKWVHLKLQSNFAGEKKLVLNMAKHSAIGFIAAGLIENIDLLFVQRYLSSYETGLMAGVSKIAAMVVLIAYSLGNVLYPRVARYQTQEHLAKYLKKSFLLVVMTIIGFLALLPFARLSILLTIGPEYLSGTEVLYILIAGSFITIATIPFLALFYAFKANWYFSISGILQLLIVVMGNVALVPEYGLVASAWTRLGMRAFLFVFTAGLGLWLYYQKYHPAFRRV